MSPELKTLDDVRRAVAEIAKSLDPGSRYVPEFLAIVEASRDVADLEARMRAGCRGQRHAGADVFERMTLERKIRCNLITNETVLFRFSEGEWEALQRAIAARKSLRILSAPCSHGEEAFSLAAACLQAGVPFAIDALDIQKEAIAEARKGHLTMGFPAAYLDSPAIVGAPVLRHIAFAEGDLLGPLPGAERYDLAVCRNFLGYFKKEIAVDAAMRIAKRLAPGGALFVDSFCVGKFPSLAPALAAAGFRRDGAHPVFTAAA